MAGFGKQGKSQPGGANRPTAPTLDAGVPKGMSPSASGAFGVKVGVNPPGKGNNDKRKAK